MPHAQAPSLAHGVATLLQALREAGVILPRVPAPNVLLSEGDIEDDSPVFADRPPVLTVHETFEHWQHAASFYARCSKITIIPRSRPSASGPVLPKKITSVFGPHAQLALLDKQESDDP
jgi:hypothetical protein